MKHGSVYPFNGRRRLSYLNRHLLVLAQAFPVSPLLLIIWIWRNVRPNVVTTHYQIATHANRAIGGHGQMLGFSFILATLSFSSYAHRWSWRGQPCLPSLLSPAKLSPPFRAFTEGEKEGERIQGSAKRRGLGCVNSLPGSAWL